MGDALSLTVTQISSGAFLVVGAIAFFGGLLTAFTPCVYPLIPITVGIMGARRATSHFQAFLLSSCFVLGLALVYSILGFTAASTGKIFGSLTQNPWMVWIVALLFLAMGLSLVGLFEFRLPYQVNQWLAKQGGNGFGGSLVLGAVSGLLAAPCSGPVVVGILAFVAQQANLVYGFSLLFIFSLGLGTPFIILGTFSQLLSQTPRGGVWTEWVKHFAGLALILAFYIYIRPLLPFFMFCIFVGVGLFALSVYVQKVFPLANHAKAIKVYEITRYVTVFASAFVVFLGIQSLKPESQDHSKLKQALNMTWVSSEEKGLSLAQQGKKLIMVDFWADWCVACKELEEKTYSNSRVQKVLSEDFVLVKIDSTKASPENQRLQQKYHIVGLPTVLFLDSQGKLFSDLTITGFVGPDEFLSVIDKAKQRINEGGACISC